MKKPRFPNAEQLKLMSPEQRAQWKRKQRAGDPDYVKNRRKDFERQAIQRRTETPAQAVAPIQPAHPRGNLEPGPASISRLAESRVQSRRAKRDGVVAGRDPAHAT